MVAFMVIGIILIIIVPLDSRILDLLLIVNITLSLVILLNTLYVTQPLQFSSFPSLLLITTLFRLSLNVSSTRLILGANGEAGNVIKTFGNFVIKGQIVVGLIIFLIIIVIQFIVITKGAERVSEVAARFTLDSMPGKQMSIDADLNAGLINEAQAKFRRQEIQMEADFYGSMDGASKFVKGDAIAGIIITIINMVGGIIIGVTNGGMQFAEVLETYSLATVGDGLVSQIPALLVSVSTGIIVTRSASKDNLSKEISGQLFSQSIVLFIGGGSLILLNFIPGLPHVPLMIMGGLLIFLGTRLLSSDKKQAEEKRVEAEEKRKGELAPPKENKQDITELLYLDPIELEFGYSIIPLVDQDQGGDLLDRVIMIRRQCAVEIGLIVPVVRLKDNMTIKPNEYIIKIKGVEIARGDVLVDHLLAMNSADDDELDGIETTEPAFGLPAKWIEPSQRDKAEMMGYTIVDPSSVMATHLTEVIKNNASELLGRQEVKTLLDNLAEKYPALVEEVVPQVVNIGTVQKVLTNLLDEKISIRDMTTILEALGDYGKSTKDTDILTEYIRQRMKREITKKYATNGKIDVLTVDQGIERMISDNIKKTDSGSYLNLNPDVLKKIITTITKNYTNAMNLGYDPVILTSPIIRIYLKKLCNQVERDLNVVSYNEIEQNVELKSVGNIKI